MSQHEYDMQWSSILLDVSNNVRERVQKVLFKRSNYEITELKWMLDSEAHLTVVEMLNKHGVSAKIISEEGECTIGEGKYFVVVDPIDGTTNLAKGIPFAVTSIAVSLSSKSSDIVAGTIMDLYTGDTYRAEHNLGAWKNGCRINPSKPKLLNNAIISIDISKGAPLEPVKELISKARYLRQFGCSALSMCLVASGVLDAHVDLRGSLRVTDVAAGLLILQESGGIYSVNGVTNGFIELSRANRLTLIAASSPNTLNEISKTIL